MVENAVNLAAIAACLDVSIDTARRMAKTGAIPAFKVGKLWRFLPSEVMAHLSRPVDPWARTPSQAARRRRAA